MVETKNLSEYGNTSKSGGLKSGRPRRRRRRQLLAIAWLLGIACVAVGATIWIGSRASSIKGELDAAARLIPELKDEIATRNTEEAAGTVLEIKSHTATAKEAAGDPLWSLASVIPGLGPNFRAVTEVARSADDVASLGLAPLVKVVSSLNWDSLLPSATGTNLQPLQDAAPSVSSAAHAVRLSAERLDRIDASALLPQVAAPLTSARDQLHQVTGALDSAANAAEILPGMLGGSEPRTYLLMIQNNAESRASGGIPGALALLTLDNGALSLGAQSSAADVGTMSPIIPVETEQQQIYTGRLGKFMQDVNLTPDFPTAASTAREMWDRKTAQRVDGVLSIDPVALSYILDATGPISIANPDLQQLARAGLPTELTGQNVVPTLLSDVYAKIEQPELQDAYFAGVAEEIFTALSNGSEDSSGLIGSITRAVGEGRVLVWSARTNEQELIAAYPLGGAIAGPSVGSAQFGVYFNDGTGAKMDYYVRRTVQLIKECPRDGYEQTTVRVTSTNTAPADASTVLPRYVTGGGMYGVPPGYVQTNITAYGPVQANVETAALDGQRTEFAPYIHDSRPVGVLAIRLAPGESRTVEFTFGKIVQHTEPNVVVTPTVQDVKDVTLPTQIAQCD